MISLLALEHYSLTTVLFPAVIAVADIVFVSMLLLRRRQVLLGA
jgi:hypothetical protein